MKFQEMNHQLSSDLEKSRQSEITLIQENKKCKQNVNEIMKKVERLLEEEATEHETALESCKRKVVSLKEKYELELQAEKTKYQQKEVELNSLKQRLEEKQKELKTCHHDLNVLKEDCHHEYEKQMNLRKRIEELISESIRNKNQSTEEKKKVHQLELEMNEMISRHHREVQSIREEMRIENQQRMEKERNLLERKSDVYRMKYENNFHEYLHSRNDSLVGQVVSRSVDSVRTSYPPPPPPSGPLPTSSGRISSDLHTSYHLQHSNEVDQMREDYEHQIKSLKDHLGKAEVTIERLKRMVLEGKESITHYKLIGEDLKNQLKLTTQRFLLTKSNGNGSVEGLSQQQQGHQADKWSELPSFPRSSHERFLSSSFSPAEENEKITASLPEDLEKIALLESEIEQLRQQLRECQQNALHEQEEDSKLLQEMQRKFDILMDKYETSAGEKSAELNQKVEEVRELKAMLKESETKFQRSEAEIVELKSILEEKSQKENTERKKFNEEILELKDSIQKINEEKDTLERNFQKELQSLEKILQEKDNELLYFGKEKEKMNLEKKFKQKEDQEEYEKEIREMKRSMQAQKRKYEKILEKYENDIESFKRLIKKFRSNFLLFQSSIESEIEMLRKEWNFICQRFQEKLKQELEEKFRKQLLSINEIQMERELNIMKYSTVNRSISDVRVQQSQQNVTDMPQNTSDSNINWMRRMVTMDHNTSLQPQKPGEITESLLISDGARNGSTTFDSTSSANASLSFHTIEIICNGYHSLLFQILDHLQSYSILTEGSCRDLRYLLTSLPSQIILSLKQYLINPALLPHPSVDSLGYSLITTKLIDIVSRGMKGFLTEKDSLTEQIQFLSNELRKEKLKFEEMELDFRKLNKENVSNIQNFPTFITSSSSDPMTNPNVSRISGRGGDISNTSIHILDERGGWVGGQRSISVGGALDNDEKQYYLTQVKHLTQQIQELKSHHKQEVDRYFLSLSLPPPPSQIRCRRIKAEALMKENLLQDKIESLVCLLFCFSSLFLIS